MMSIDIGNVLNNHGVYYRCMMIIIELVSEARNLF